MTTTSPIYMHPDTLRRLIETNAPQLPENEPLLNLTYAGLTGGVEVQTSNFLPPGTLYLNVPLPRPEPFFNLDNCDLFGLEHSRYRYSYRTIGLTRSNLYSAFLYGGIGDADRPTLAQRRRDRKAAAKKARRIRIKAENIRRAKK